MKWLFNWPLGSIKSHKKYCGCEEKGVWVKRQCVCKKQKIDPNPARGKTLSRWHHFSICHSPMLFISLGGLAYQGPHYLDSSTFYSSCSVFLVILESSGTTPASQGLCTFLYFSWNALVPNIHMVSTHTSSFCTSICSTGLPKHCVYLTFSPDPHLSRSPSVTSPSAPPDKVCNMWFCFPISSVNFLKRLTLVDAMWVNTLILKRQINMTIHNERV